MNKLRGVIPPIATPLAHGDRVDEASLKRLVRYLLDGGVHGLFVNGSMGGFAFLRDEEQLRAISTVVAEVNGTIPVMGGVGDTSSSRAVPKAKAIAREGVTHLTVLPPFFFPATQKQLKAYFSEIAAAVDLPIFLYDNPLRTNCNILPDTVADLRQSVPNIVGIKVSNEDCNNLQDLLIRMRDDVEFSVLTGSESLILLALQMGCDGCVGGAHNICPHIAVELYQAFKNGDYERARECQHRLISVCEIFSYGSIWGGFDEAMRFLGICERATGAPYVTKLDAQEKSKVHTILERYAKPAIVPARP